MEDIDLHVQSGVSPQASERFQRPRNYGPLDRFDGHARITGPCGDTLEFWLRVNEGRIAAASFTTTGCGPSRAAGSMATELAIGQPPTEAAQIEQADILAALGSLPKESEHCALLASNTLKSAIEDLESRKADNSPDCRHCDSATCSSKKPRRDEGRRILFDTGQGRVLRHNAGHLGISLDTVEIMVISHGHFDHTGGLTTAIEANRRVTVYLHPAALESKYVRQKSPPHRSIRFPGFNKQTLRHQAPNVVWTSKPTELMPGVHLTGEIPRRNDFEDTGGPFFRDEACTEADPLLDDQALYVETPAGTVVVLGCAHAGVVNTLDYIAELTGGTPIYAVLGGMHLARATQQRLEATATALKRYGVERVGTAHCTGMRAASYLWCQLPDECFECSVGSVLTV